MERPIATQRITCWKSKLERLLGSSQDRDLGDVIDDIRDLGEAMGHDTGEALLDAHPEFFAYSDALTRAFHQTVHEADVNELERLLSLNEEGPIAYKSVASEMSKAFYNRMSETFDLVNFDNCRRAVMVGCGRIPFTIFHIHDRTTVPEIIGIDVMPEAVEAANMLAAKLGYNRMRAEVCDGRHYDYSDTQVVYVANMVSPKAAAASRIADTAPDDVQIILWEPYSLGRLWSENAERSLDPRLEVAGRSSVSRSLTRDILVKRRGRSASREQSW